MDGAVGTINFIAACAGSVRARGRKPYIFDAARLPARHATRSALGQQHLDDVFGRAVAKQLALVLLVKWDLVLVHQGHKLRWGVACQRRTAKAWVLAQEIGGAGAQVGEVTAPTTRDANFFGHLLAMVQYQYL